MATYAVVGSKDTYDTLEALLPSSGADRVSAVSDLPKPEYDAIVFSVTADNVKEFTHLQTVKDVFQKLKSGGKLFVTAPAEVGAAPQFTVMLKSTSIGQNDVSMELMLAGFEDVDAKTEPQPHTVAVRPSWTVGASASLPKKVEGKVEEEADAKKAWTLQASDFQEDGELEDEDALLESDVVGPKDESSCATKRRACANCTCGRAEEEASAAKAEAVQMSPEELLQKTSSCGNCYKGDAFRCASCPYKGLPAFQPGMGDQVLLDLSSDL